MFRMITIVLVLAFFFAGCNKENGSPNINTNSPVDTTVPAVSTSDFRSAYTGNFMVHYISWRSYNNTVTESLDTSYVINISYQIQDSGSYINNATFDPPDVIEYIKHPKLTAYVNSVLLFDMMVDANATAVPAYNLFQVEATTRSGGFITTDSINYTYHLANPHVTVHHDAVGHRVP